MSSLGDRWITKPGDLIITTVESDEERFAAFAEPFGELGADGIFYDRRLLPLKIVPSWTDGLDRYAAFELKRAAMAIADPDEIWEYWKKGHDGGRVWARHYLRSADGIDLCVQVSREGWRFATSEDPMFELDGLRRGELAWGRVP